MSNIFDVEDDAPIASTNPYLSIGFPRNPFREGAKDEFGQIGPFYAGHIAEEVEEIKNWIRDIRADRFAPLALVGNIGAGKTRILTYVLASQLRSTSRKMVGDVVVLSQSGYSRPSVGGTVISALQRMNVRLPSPTPEGALPIVWGIVSGTGILPEENYSPLCSALRTARSGSRKAEQAKIISRWLQRDYLSTRESHDLNLPGRIDWEGELIHILADLFRFARASGAADTIFLFFDQLEDLFRPDLFTDLRRSRLLTDLRALVDEADSGAPIGLILSWTPDFGAISSMPIGVSVDRQFQREYQALYSRLNRRRVNLDLLPFDKAVPFANEWINALVNLPGFERHIQPNASLIVERAWERITKSAGPRVQKETPRVWLTAMSDVIDDMAGA